MGAEGPGFETYPDASFTYDSMGNRVEVVFAAQTDNYTSNELNQYTTVSSTNYDYDLNGNLTDDGNQLYEYDWENRLTAVRRKSDNALIAEYRYDPFGRRVKKFVHIPEFKVVNYLYDGAQVIEERNEDFELEQRFVYGPGIDEPISVHNISSGQTYFYQRDGLGSVTELTDAEGTVIERYRYSPYGKLKVYDRSWTQLTGSTVGNAYFFTGRRYDPESGIYYYRARMYSSELGRFLQVDPIGYWDTINLYIYCGNNPLNWIDPIGKETVQIGIAGGGGAGTGGVGSLGITFSISWSNGFQLGYYSSIEGGGHFGLSRAIGFEGTISPNSSIYDLEGYTLALGGGGGCLGAGSVNINLPIAPTNVWPSLSLAIGYGAGADVHSYVGHTTVNEWVHISNPVSALVVWAFNLIY